jgi:RNA polymerase sigma-70 factor (ECF subfamily)
MPKSEALPTLELEALSDADLVALACRRHAGAFRLIMQRHNRRLYRVARSVLGDAAEAEDVVQEAYVRAFAALDGFRTDASLATWLTRIALNEGLGRLRRRRPSVGLEVLDSPKERDGMRVIPFPGSNSAPSPEQAAARQEIRQVLERAIDGLPEHFRTVFVMRDVEGINVEETAAHLALRPETVRTRLHRARAQLRRTLTAELASTVTEAFPFAGPRCAGLADAVLARLSLPIESEPNCDKEDKS